MHRFETLTIKFDSIESAFDLIDDISELVYRDQLEDYGDPRSGCADKSSRIEFSWDGVTFCSCNAAYLQVRQERFGLINESVF